MDKQSLEWLLAQGLSIERIAKCFGKDPSTVSYWMKKHGLVTPYREKHAAKGGIAPERLEALVEAGMTIAEIAEQVVRSKATVRHWMREYGLRTKNSRGRRPRSAWRSAKAEGKVTVAMACAHHGLTEFILEGRGYYRCKRCRAERVAQHRRKVKAILVEEAGGRCQLCGYDRWIGALQFHHTDPGEKKFNIALRGVARSLERVRAEARKCALLCANCHAEVEAGIAALPDTVLTTGCPRINDSGQPSSSLRGSSIGRAGPC